MFLKKAIFISVLMVTVNSYAQLQSGSPWPMYGQNLQHTGQTNKNVPAMTGSPYDAWSYYVGFGNFNTPPAIAKDGTIYVGFYGSPNNVICAINPNGTPKWSYTSTEIFYSSLAIGGDGTIYAGNGINGLQAIKPDGTLKWSYTGTNPFFTTGPAIGNDGTIYIGSMSNLCAVKTNGTLKWTYHTTGQFAYSSPAIGIDGTVYIGNGNNKLFAIRTNGTLRWSYTTGSYIWSSPAIGNDGTVYVGSDDLYAIRTNGTLRWTFTTPWGFDTQGNPAIGKNETVYIGRGDGTLFAIQTNGTIKWSFPSPVISSCCPAIANDGTIYVEINSNLCAITTNGILLWSIQTSGWISGNSPAIANNGQAYIQGGINGIVSAISATEPPISFISSCTGTSSVGLVWQKNILSGGGFIVQNALTNTGPWHGYITNYSGFSITNTGLQSGKQYWFRIASQTTSLPYVISDWVTLGPIMTRIGSSTVTTGLNSPASTNVSAGHNNTVMLQFRVSAINESMQVTNLTLKASGSGIDNTETANIVIWYNSTGDGTTSGSTKLTLSGGNYASDNGTITFHSSDFSSNPVIPAGGSVNFIITYDFQASAVGGHTFAVTLTNGICFGVNSFTSYNIVGLPIHGNLMTITGLGGGGSAPVATYLSPTNMSASLDAYRDNVSIKAIATQASNANVNFSFQFKCDALGIDWTTAIIKESTVNLAPSVPHIFTWDSLKDIGPKVVSGVLFRLTPSTTSSSIIGLTIQTGPFTVNNVSMNPADVQVGKSFHDMNKDGNVNIILYPTTGGSVSVTVYDLRGRKIRTFTADVTSGINTLQWDMKDDSGKLVASEIYALRVQGAGLDKVVKVSVYK